MSKVKSKGAKDASKVTTDVLTKVKDAAVTKPAQTLKAKSKDLAKQVAAKEEKKPKKVKEPTPESSDADSESSDSDVESEKEVKPVVNGKSNGKVKAAVADDESDESDSSDSTDDDAPTNGVLGKAPAVTAVNESSDDDESDDSDDEIKPPVATADSSEEESDDESDEETVVEKPVQGQGPTKIAETNESDESDSSSEDDESEQEVVTKSTKRKADDSATPAPKKTKTDEAAEGQGNNLFVGNLSWNVDEEWLSAEFEKFGELAGIRVITDRATGRSKGFGYVEYANAADAAKAHAQMKDAELDNRKINVDFASNRSSGGAGQQDRAQNRAKTYGDKQSPPTDTLFVGNLAFEVGQDAVSQAFGECGTILGIRLPTDRESGQPKGFGYVQFASVEEAQGALESMQGYELEGRAVRLDFSQPRPQNSDSPGRGRGGFGGRGRGGFSDRGGRGGFGDRGGRGGGRGRGGFGDRGGRGGRGGSTNRGGFGDFSGKKITF